MAVLSEVKYEDQFGAIYNLKLSAISAAAAGTEPTGGVSTDVSPKITKSEREFGIRPRGVRVSKIFGTAPDEFRKYKFIPILTQAEWLSAAYSKGAIVVIDGENWTVTSKVAEDY